MVAYDDRKISDLIAAATGEISLKAGSIEVLTKVKTKAPDTYHRIRTLEIGIFYAKGKGNMDQAIEYIEKWKKHWFDALEMFGR